MQIQFDLAVVIWILIAILIIVGIILFIQLFRFFKQLGESTKKFEDTLEKANILIDQCNKMTSELTEISRRVNVNYKQINKVVDNVGLGISNFVLSKFDNNKRLGYRKRNREDMCDE